MLLLSQIFKKFDVNSSLNELKSSSSSFISANKAKWESQTGMTCFRITAIIRYMMFLYQVWIWDLLVVSLEHFVVNLEYCCYNIVHASLK